MDTIDLQQAKEELVRINSELNIPHLLIGGLAVQRYVVTRDSKDIDLVCSYEQARELVEKLYPTHEWDIKELNDDAFRPSFEIVHRFKNKDKISFGPKITERDPYDYIDWQLLLEHGTQYVFQGKPLNNIIIPSSSDLAFTKLVSFLGRSQEKKSKRINDLKDLSNLSNDTTFRINDFLALISRTNAQEFIKKNFALTDEEELIFKYSSIRRQHHILGAAQIVNGVSDSSIMPHDAARLKDEFNTDVTSKLAEKYPIIEPDDSLRLDKRDRSSYQNNYNKFDFKYRYLEFVGRDLEKNALWKFLGKVDDEKKFLWWMLTGPGGIGKSRLAQDFCLNTHYYYSGFLDTNFAINWDIWIPVKPTLIVIDYALSKVENLENIIKKIAFKCHSFHHPVRMLLLDREETDEWVQKRRPGTEIDDCLYKENEHTNTAVLKIEPLSESHRKDILRQVIQQENKSKWDEVEQSISDITKKLNELDESGRPLFTFFVGMALSKGENIRDWNTNDLLKNTLLRFEQLWEKYVDSDLLSITKLILLINTFTGSLSNNEVDALLHNLNTDINFSNFISSYSIIADHKTERDTDWFGLQPDLLGEYFIIKTINEIVKKQPLDGYKTVSELMRLSWQQNHTNTITMCYMLWSDFEFKKTGENLKIDISKILYEQILRSENEDVKKDLAIMFLNRCGQKCEQGLLQESKVDGTAAISLDPKEPVAYNNRGVALTELGEYNKAIEDFNKGLELDNGNATLYYNQGRAFRELGEKLTAKKLFDKSIELDPQHPNAYNDRGLVKYDLRMFVDSVRDLDIAIKLKENPHSYNNRGLSKRALGFTEEAILDYDKAIELDDKLSLNYYNRSLAKGDLAIKKGDISYIRSAIEDLNFAIALDGTDFDFYRHRGDFYLDLGEMEMGYSDLEVAIKMGDKEAEVLYKKRKQKTQNQKIGRNARVAVKYTNGEIKTEVKYKKVEADILNGKCIIIE